MTIERVLSISTAHISAETDEKLRNGDMDEAGMSVYEKGEFGWFIFVDHVVECFWYKDEIPEDLMRCIRLAQANHCEWLCLDRDAETVDNLPTYDWQWVII